MTDEMQSLKKNKTWVLVDLLENTRVVGSMRILKRNEGVQGGKKCEGQSKACGKGIFSS